jgi:hypothetical protein
MTYPLATSLKRRKLSMWPSTFVAAGDFVFDPENEKMVAP